MSWPASGDPLTFGDTECISLRSGARVIWEAGFVMDVGGLVREMLVQIRPDMSMADPSSLEICRFGERFALPDGVDAALMHPEAGRMVVPLAEAEAAEVIATALRDTHLFGVVPSFDALRLELWLRAQLGSSYTWESAPWHYQPYDVEDLAAGVLIGQAATGLYPRAAAALRQLGMPYNTDVLFRYFDVPDNPESRHTALGDARAAYALWQKMHVTSGFSIEALNVSSSTVALILSLTSWGDTSADVLSRLASLLHEQVPDGQVIILESGGSLREADADAMARAGWVRSTTPPRSDDQAQSATEHR
ncbi:hypothetical protein [Frankia sp. AvcI1]|uniref:hypothetical protein n=1 Tax=Frankia sp. AvcI1 TaxID=573496 RepID=UPI0021177219|nr:hypothetical protein [Frankia sp. AvcI1]